MWQQLLMNPRRWFFTYANLSKLAAFYGNIGPKYQNCCRNMRNLGTLLISTQQLVILKKDLFKLSDLTLLPKHHFLQYRKQTLSHQKSDFVKNQKKKKSKSQVGKINTHITLMANMHWKVLHGRLI